MLRIVALGHILDLQYRMILIDGHICTEQCKENTALNRNICNDVVPCFSLSVIIFFLSEILCILFIEESTFIYIYMLPDTTAT